MLNWAHQLQRLLLLHSRVVMVTIAETKGSTPREAGAKFFALPESIVGTIGGGNLEHQATKIARELLIDTQQHKTKLKHFSLSAGLGMCCGGLVELIFEVIDQSDQLWLEQWIECCEQQLPMVLITQLENKEHIKKIVKKNLFQKALNKNKSSSFLIKDHDELLYLETVTRIENHLYLFGAGHVGQAIVAIMKDLPWHITWVDTRDDCLSDQFIDQLPEHVNFCQTDSPEAEIAQAKKDSLFLVMTHDHALDLVLCEHILNKSDVLYFGVIGSQTKRKRFEHRLVAKGFAQSQLDQMICPIGIDGINSKHPSSIAVSVVAQLLQKVEIKTEANFYDEVI